MKNKIILFFILFGLFGLIIWVSFGNLIKQIYHSYNATELHPKVPINHEPLFIRTWTLDKERNEEKMKQDYLANPDTLPFEEHLRINNFFVSNKTLDLQKDGRFEQLNQGMTPVKTIGEWNNYEGYLILNEKYREAFLETDRPIESINLITWYFKVVKIDSTQLVISLDLSKTRNMPKEMREIVSGDDTTFYKAINQH